MPLSPKTLYTWADRRNKMNLTLFVGPGYGKALLREVLRTNRSDLSLDIIYYSQDVKTACRYLTKGFSSLQGECTFNKKDGYPTQASCLQQADCILLLWWPEILPEYMLKGDLVNPINIHPSPLPVGRGKSPNFWAIYSDLPVGATAHWIDESIDGGRIIYRVSEELGFGSTGRDAYRISIGMCIKLVRLLLERLEEVIVGKDMYHMCPLSPLEFFSRRKVRLSRDFTGMQSFTIDGGEVEQFIRHALAKKFRPFSGLTLKYKGIDYEIDINLRKLSSNG
jgi:Formyl transferase